MNEANFPARWNEELLAECPRIAHIGGWICDLTGRFSWADETYRVFAVDPAAFTPNLESILKLIHPGDRSAVQAWMDACRAGEKPGELTFRRILPDGSIRLISGRGELKYDAENRPSHMTGTSQDITEWKRAEGILLQNRTLMETAGRIARFGGWSVDLAENKLIWCDQVSAIHEMPADFSPRLDEGIGFYAPEWQTKIAKVFGDCARDGRSYDEEMEIITGRGKRIWVRTLGMAVRNEAGTIVRVEGMVQDITAQKETEQRLRDSEMRARLLVENAPDAIFVQTGGCFAYLNAPALRLFGADTADDLLGTPVPDRLHPDFRQVVGERIRLLNEEKSAVPQIEEICLRLDGSPVPVEVSAVPIRYDGSDGALVFVRDITQRKRVEARLAEQLDELRRWHNITMGREGRVLELKQEVNELLARAGQPPRYLSVVEEPAGSEP